jgi:hypothetical protein
MLPINDSFFKNRIPVAWVSGNLIWSFFKQTRITKNRVEAINALASTLTEMNASLAQ